MKYAYRSAHLLDGTRDMTPQTGKIVCVEGSRIAEMGTREELIARDGEFAKLWRAQNLNMN